MGHSACGAVAGALIEGAEFSTYLQSVINRIRPAVVGEEELASATVANIRHNVGLIQANPIVAEAGAMVLGAKYDIVTGVVSFVDLEVEAATGATP